jgi:hypothetical protein
MLQLLKIQFFRLSLTFIVLSGVAKLAIAQQTDIPPDSSGDFLVPPETFPVFPWDILPANAQAYAQARQCGLNLAGFAHVQDLDKVNAAHMKCFVGEPQILDVRNSEKLTDEQIKAKVQEVVSKSKDNPALFGYHVVDEPSPALVPTIVRWTKAFQQADPNAIAYVNMLPIHGAADPGKREADYQKYLASYLDQAKPKAFSFDYYSMMDDGSIRPTWFDCLEVVRKESIRTGVPFWNVCLACAHFRYAEPSLATLRFQVYSSLAYGAKGIGWFTYTQRDRGNYRDSAIDLFGHRTPTWDMLREVNLQIHRLAPVMSTLKSVDVFHWPTVPQGCKGLSESRFVSVVRGTGPFAIGEFTDPKGRAVVMIVNCDLQHGTHFNIVPKEKSTVLRVSAFSGVTRPFGAEDDWLPPGGGVLLIFDAQSKPAADGK